jgi:hypothetical protein
VQVTRSSAPQVVVEEQSMEENRWRIATLVVLGLTVFACICFGGVLTANSMQFGAAGADSPTPKPTKSGQVFAATWTPTPTDTASPTAPPRPTATDTATPTETPTPTNTSIPPTATNTPRPPTKTPTRRPPTNTPRPRPTNTPVPPPGGFPLRITSVRTYPNCCSLGVFGTIRTNGSGLMGGVNVRVIPVGSSTGLQTTSAGGFIGGGTDRNYEISNASGMGAGTYTVVAVDAFGTAVSPATQVTVCGMGSASCAQWIAVDFQQN